LRADSLDRLPGGSDLVGAKIVHEDDVVLAQGRREDLLDISQERWAIHGTIDDTGCREAIDTQRCDERQRLPVAMRHAGDEALAARRSPIAAHHLRRHRRLVDKDETRRAELGLLGFQRSASGRNVRAILLGGVQCFF
jgi:hypothetical protein